MRFKTHNLQNNYGTSIYFFRLAVWGERLWIYGAWSFFLTPLLICLPMALCTSPFLPHGFYLSNTQLLSQCQGHQKGTQNSLSWSRSPWCLVRSPSLSRPIFLTLQWRWGTRGLWFPDVSASYSSLKWWLYLFICSIILIWVSGVGYNISENSR